MDNSPTPEPKWYQDRWLLGVLLLAGVLGLIYNFAVLIGYGPDEVRHMAYVKLLFDEHRLPFLLPDGSEYAGAHTLHPPLYYLILLPFYAVLRGLPEAWTWHALRVLSLLFCLAALPLIYQIAWRAGRGTAGNGNVWLARLATAQLALLPIFGMTSGVINNDSLQLLLVTLFLWLLSVQYPQERSLRSALILGVVFGLGAMTKATALICDGVALVLYLLAQDGRAVWRSRRAWERLGLTLLVGVLIGGFWYARNLALYGELTPVEGGYTSPLLPSPDNGMLVMMLHDNFPRLFAYANWGIFYSLWSQKDWIPEAVRQPIYWVLLAYCLPALLGILRRGGKATSQERLATWPAYGAFGATWLACLFMALFKHWGWAEGGRYLLPALPGFSLFLARGWRGFAGERSLPVLCGIWIVAMLALNALAIYWLFSYLNPTFGPHGL